jgi:hypothetical protein
MKVVNEIREYFASLPTPGARRIENISPEYSAYVIRIPQGYGVAIEAPDSLIVSERFNDVRLYTDGISINGVVKNYLVLRATREESRHEFAYMSAEFVDPGKNGENRKELLKEPFIWWKRWKELSLVKRVTKCNN